MKHIFIVGCSRSGTTLLQSLLTAHSKVYSLPETRFFARMAGNAELRMFGEPLGPEPLRDRLSSHIRSALRLTTRNPRRWAKETFARIGKDSVALLFPNRPTLMRTAAKTYLEILDQLTANAGADTWVEKTPIHVHYLDKISRYAPSARVIHLIRDGREVVASLHDAAQKYPNTHWERYYTSVDNCVKRWNKALSDSLKYIENPKHYFIRYESLIAEPDEALRKVASFADIPFEKNMLSRSVAMESKIFTELEPWKLASLQKINRRPESKFIKLFPASEQIRICRNLKSSSTIDEAILLQYKSST